MSTLAGSGAGVDGVLQVRVHGPGDVRLDQVDAPEPGPRDVVVRVVACGVCGSDTAFIRLGGLAGPSDTLLCLGHEMAGVVHRVGADVERYRLGDRVVVQPGDDQVGRIGAGAPQGGLTPLLLVTDADQGRLHPVPDNLSLELAALAEPLAVGMRAVNQADVRPGEGVAVFGCGPVGLCAIATLIDRGHKEVVAVDLSHVRLELARELGAQAALNPATTDVWKELAHLHGRKPFMLGPTAATAVFIEASGSARVIDDIIENSPRGGRISVVALHHEPVPTNFMLVMAKELTIRGSMEYPERFADAIDLLARRDLSSMITHRVPLEQFDEALLLVGARDCGKVMVSMNSA